jgi:hypothetical protein
MWFSGLVFLSATFSLETPCMKSLSLRLSFAGSLAWTSCLAFAHEGHGLEGASHWHATDTLGLLIGAAAVAAVIWFTRGGK